MAQAVRILGFLGRVWNNAWPDRQMAFAHDRDEEGASDYMATGAPAAAAGAAAGCFHGNGCLTRLS